MVLDLDRIKSRQKETQRKSGGKYFKPQEGRNLIRVFAFKHKVTKADVASGFFNKKLLGKTATELDRPVTRFFDDNGPSLVAGESDPRVKAWKSKMAKASKSQQQKLKKNGPQTHYFLNVVDTQDPDRGMLEYACSKTVYNAVLDYILDPDFGEEVLGCSGRDFIITYKPEEEGSNKYSVKIRPEGKSEKLAQSLESEVKDYYDPAVYETLGSDSSSSESDEEEEEDLDDEDLDDEESEEEESDEEEEDESEDDEEEEEDDLDDDEEEESEDVEEEDELDDDEEEEEVKPKKKSKAPTKKSPAKKPVKKSKPKKK